MKIEFLIDATTAKMKEYVLVLNDKTSHDLYEMISYHFGWDGLDTNRGKFIRPLLVLLTCEAVGGEWKRSVPAAAAVEFLHNFSLVIDDVEDKSQVRRGKTSVWAKWGFDHGINTGNTLFIMASIAINDIHQDFTYRVAQNAVTIFNSTCLEMTIGQSLDLSSQKRTVDINTYWKMIAGKTAALLAGSCHIGALLGGADSVRQEAFRSFGEYLGLAFQSQDDILGIWGDEKMTGKSAASDLTESKLSLPVLYGLSKNGKFAELWNKGPISPSEITQAADLLVKDGAHEYAQQQAYELTGQALHFLEIAQPDGEAGRALFELANRLLKREQ